MIARSLWCSAGVERCLCTCLSQDSAELCAPVERSPWQACMCVCCRSDGDGRISVDVWQMLVVFISTRWVFGTLTRQVCYRYSRIIYKEIKRKSIHGYVLIYAHKVFSICSKQWLLYRCFVLNWAENVKTGNFSTCRALWVFGELSLHKAGLRATLQTDGLTAGGHLIFILCSSHRGMGGNVHRWGSCQAKRTTECHIHSSVQGLSSSSLVL